MLNFWKPLSQFVQLFIQLSLRALPDFLLIWEQVQDIVVGIARPKSIGINRTQKFWAFVAMVVDSKQYLDPSE